MIGRVIQSGWTVRRLLLIAVVVAGVSGTSWLVLSQKPTRKTEYNSQPAGSSTSQQQVLQNGAQPASPVYSSSKEGASFKYPSDWTAAKPSATSKAASNDASNTDQTVVTSPSGALKISWITNIVGFGNEHGDAYPLITVVDKTPISGAPGYYVVSGITTLDGSTYHPWLAVQDANGILTSGVQGDLVTFTARRVHNPTTDRQARMLFATCGPHSVDNSPALTQVQATSWFSSTEVQQAKQFLLGFSDPQ